MKKKFGFTILAVILVALSANAQRQDSLSHATLLAVGDINLGRSVGQELLKGKIDYPFEKITGLFHQADIVFANLESPISDQHGETQSPKSNIIFCAPPVAGISLQHAHITVVSTSNNHQFDYGMKGLSETINDLQLAGILSAGTTNDSSNFRAAIVHSKGITIGVLAYTQLVNIHHGWCGRIAFFDSMQVADAIRRLKPTVDLVVVSFHGGIEYMDISDSLTSHQLHWIAESGADIVLGHHPHVPQGIEQYKSSWIIHSLGNTVFYQPQKTWTQWSYAVEFSFEKRNEAVAVSSIQLIPLHAGYQPTAQMTPAEADKVIKRISKLSNVHISNKEKGYFVENTAETSLR